MYRGNIQFEHGGSYAMFGVSESGIDDLLKVKNVGGIFVAQGPNGKRTVLDTSFAMLIEITPEG